MSSVAAVVVLGGGIAGLSAAVALRRAGMSVKLIEMSDTIRRRPIPVGVWGPGLRVLETLVGDRATELIASRGASMTLAGYSSLKTGEWLLRPTDNAIPTYPSLQSLTFFREEELVDLLLSSLPEDVIHLGQNGKIVDNPERQLIVDATGGAVEDHAQALYYAARGVSKYNIQESFQGFGFSDQRYRFAAVPIQDGYISWFFTSLDRLSPHAETLRQIKALSQTWGHTLPGKILDHAHGEDNILVEAVYPPSPSFSRPTNSNGIITIPVGDAAHRLDPILSMGITVALEDAFALSKCTNQGKFDLEAFTRMRQDRHKGCNMISYANYQLACGLGASLHTMRDASLQTVNRMRPLTDKLFTYAIDFTLAPQLPLP